MSFFEFKVSSLSKIKNNEKKDGFFRNKIVEDEFSSRLDFNSREENQERSTKLSPFVIDECDLWNPDSDSDLFELPEKDIKDISNLKIISPEKYESTNTKSNHQIENKDSLNLDNSTDDLFEDKNDSDFQAPTQDISQVQNNFDIDFEPYFSPGFQNEEAYEHPKSPIFDLTNKVNQRNCSFNNKENKNITKFSNEKLETLKTDESSGEKNISSASKVCQENKYKPLGLGSENKIWLQTMLKNEAFHNALVETSDQKLQSTINFLNKSYHEILEKIASAFEILPLETLKHFPDFDPDVFITLKTTKKRIKALTIKIKNIMKKRNLLESSSAHQDYLDVPNHLSLLNERSLESKSSSGFSNSSINDINDKSSNNLNYSLESTFLNHEASKHLSPSSATFLKSSNQESKSGIIDYTEMLYKSPGKEFQDCSTPGKEKPHANMRNDSLSGEFDGFNFPHSHELLKKFKEKFGLKNFRPNQLQVMNAALLGHDCFVLMPTGGGKSLCYQLPAVVSKGVTVVISPLRSLILDQVTKLLTLDISACHLSGDIKESEVHFVYSRLNKPEPDIKLLYVTPEKVGVSNSLKNCFLGLYKRKMLARFVIDEAHCVSQWGHDFRPDYKKLRELRENFPEVNIMALTATATPRVRIDILHQLLMSNPKWFLSSFNRTNLTYEVKDKKGKSTLKDIADLIKNEYSRDTGIVYCFSRKECEDVAKALKNHGIMAIPYHAGLNDDERTRVQNMWMNGKVKVVCATIAFGMGIDKLDVRFVIHYTLPKSIEGYYQESGRAGRDGEKSNCILYYCYRDKHRILKLINMDQSMATRAARKIHIDNLFRVVAFAENKTDCRRALQLEYFGEKFNRKMCLSNKSTACDNCLQQGMYETVDVTAESKAIVSAVKQVCGTDRLKYSNYTMLHFVEVFKGTGMKKVESEGHDKLPLCGMGKSWQRLDAERLFRKLVMEEFLTERILVKEDGVTCVYLKIGRRGEDLLRGNIVITFEIKKTKKNLVAIKSDKVSNEKRVDPAILELQEKCYSELTDVIRGIASSLNCNPNAIMNVQALRIMSSTLPQTPEEMLTINHVTTANFEKYGSILLEITKKYASDKKALSLEVAEINEEEFFEVDPWASSKNENSHYFDTDITFCGKGNGKGGGRKRKKTNFRKWQSAKKWKGSGGAVKGPSKAKSNGKTSAKITSDGSGVKTISGANFSTLMELPTSKARGFSRPKVILKDL